MSDRETDEEPPSSNDGGRITAPVSWPKLIPKILARRHLTCREHDAASARELLERMQLEEEQTFVDGTTVPKEMEKILFEAMIEDDYDGALHLTTVHNESSEAIGLVFWREVSSDEMEEWIDYGKLVELSRGWAQREILDDEDQDDLERWLDTPGENDNELDDESGRQQSRKSSLRWLANWQSMRMTNDGNGPPERRHTNYKVPSDYAQAWVKIELLAVRRRWWGQKIGSLLMACAIYHAWLRKDKRCILHVAGGLSNVPAVRLYEKFGFVQSPEDIFRRPNRDLFILGNIGRALQSVVSNELLQINKQDSRALEEGSSDEGNVLKIDGE